MSKIPIDREPLEKTERRADELFQDHLQRIHKRADRVFAWLLMMEWLAGIAVAIWISPRAWSGSVGLTHLHVWAAIFLGGGISAFPIFLAIVRPGWALTRHVIAIGQMLMGALLIHLTGGRIESHFHIFGSLALLATYRDYRVLVTASAVVAVDHCLRGILWPQSVFGVAVVSHWRWLEHVAWVLFEDIFLIRFSIQSTIELREITQREAQLEATRDRVELAVWERTVELTQQSEVLQKTTVQLCQSEEQFQIAFESAAIGMTLMSLGGRWLKVNRAACQILGYSESELLTMRFQDITHPDDVARDLELKRRLAAGDLSNIQLDKRYSHKDGHIVHVRLSVALVRSSQGIPLHYVTQIDDVTSRLLAQEERDRFFTHTPNLMVVVGYDTQIKRVNPAVLSICGWSTEDDLISKPFFHFFHGDDIRAVTLVFETLLEHGGTEVYEARGLQADGSYKWFSWSVTAFPDWQVVYVTAIDVTGRMQAEAALRINQAAMDAAANGIAISNVEGDIEWINPAFTKMTGYSATDAIGQNWRTLRSQRHTLEFYDQMWGTIRSGHVWYGELINERKDGSLYDEEMTITPVRSALGQITHFVAIKQDITERKKAQTESQQAKTAAENANRAKSEFLANMSHEIRTPMNGILGLTSLVLDTELATEQRQYLDGVLLSAESLLKIINSILDFSKIEAGKMELEKIDFHLREVLWNATKTLAMRACEKKLELLYDVRNDVPDALIGDPTRLCQVVINLVGNALKFTERGEVSVLVGLEEELDDEVILRFTVSDTGVGIPFSKQADLFQPFVQADTSTTRTFGGTGLGLAISQSLIQMMGGRIWFESQEGLGSQFHFTVGFGRQTGLVANPVPLIPTNIRGLRVLVVDDNATNRRIQSVQLTQWGMRPAEADSGPAALAVLQVAIEADDPFDLIILDVMMPEMDGLEVLEQVRSMPNINRPTILMLSAMNQRGDLARARELGVSAYLVKPIRPPELHDAIMTALSVQNKPTTPQSAVSPITPAESKGLCLRILVAEDNALNQLLARRILVKVGHSVMVVNNGAEALVALESEAFDLVLMDIQMPVMDGFQATAMIRQREIESGEHLPIIAMTAHAIQGDRERCLEAGVDGYVSKPIRNGELFGAIANVLAKKELPLVEYCREKKETTVLKA